MNTADLITSFFNNEMSPEQERQFLVSVASSDSLRLGLKSHVMLDKILQDQSASSRVSPETRGTIMREAAIVAGAAAAGGALASEKAHAAQNVSSSAGSHNAVVGSGATTVAGTGFFGWSRVTTLLLTLLLGTGSFFAGFFTGSETQDVPEAVTGADIESDDRSAIPAPQQSVTPIVFDQTESEADNTSTPDESANGTQMSESRRVRDNVAAKPATSGAISKGATASTSKGGESPTMASGTSDQGQERERTENGASTLQTNPLTKKQVDPDKR